jgi:DNA polymerase delta subunit 2
MHNEDYRLPLGKLKQEGGDMQQFNSFYYKRLEQQRPAVKEAARLKWEAKHDVIDFVDNILDLKTSTLTVIIGTVFKDQKKKPCVLQNLLGVIKSADPLLLSIGADENLRETKWNGHFVSEDDQVILEDSSGRINIKASPKFIVDEQITGSIIAILGKADKQGYFEVDDFCFAGIPFQSDIPHFVPGMTRNMRDLFDTHDR